MKQVDFLVVGAGIAGLSAAARLARHGSTLVVEAEAAPGVHSSGRSAAFAHFDMDAWLVRALTAASLPLFAEPGATPHPALFIALAGQEAALDRLEAEYSALAGSNDDELESFARGFSQRLKRAGRNAPGPLKGEIRRALLHVWDVRDELPGAKLSVPNLRDAVESLLVLLDNHERGPESRR